MTNLNDHDLKQPLLSSEQQHENQQKAVYQNGHGLLNKANHNGHALLNGAICVGEDDVPEKEYNNDGRSGNGLYANGFKNDTQKVAHTMTGSCKLVDFFLIINHAINTFEILRHSYKKYIDALEHRKDNMEKIQSNIITYAIDLKETISKLNHSHGGSGEACQAATVSTYIRTRILSELRSFVKALEDGVMKEKLLPLIVSCEECNSTMSGEPSEAGEPSKVDNESDLKKSHVISGEKYNSALSGEPSKADNEITGLGFGDYLQIPDPREISFRGICCEDAELICILCLPCKPTRESSFRGDICCEDAKVIGNMCLPCSLGDVRESNSCLETWLLPLVLIIASLIIIAVVILLLVL